MSGFTALGWQGIVFCGLAVSTALLSLFLPPLPAQMQMLLLCACILALGVPHGAFDTIYARKLYGLQGFYAWLSFGLLYLLLAGMVVAVWKWMPDLFLLLFLLLSLAHFSGDPEPGTSAIFQVLYGGSPLVLPALNHSGELAYYFQFLIPGPGALSFANALQWLSWPWLIAVLVSALVAARARPLAAAEMGSVALLAGLATPLLSFTLFFCGMHSARHILRTWEWSETKSRALFFQAAALPVIGTVLLLATATYLLRGQSFESFSIQLVFVLLAAFTVPHMALVERIRFSSRTDV